MFLIFIVLLVMCALVFFAGFAIGEAGKYMDYEDKKKDFKNKK